MASPIGTLGRVRSRLARLNGPPQTIQGTRWVFLMMCVFSMLVCFPAVLSVKDPHARLGGILAGLLVVVSWSYGYRTRTAIFATDLLDALLFFLFSMACPQPEVVLGVVFAALWFRSLYGPTWRSVLRTLVYVGAIVATFVLWTKVSWHPTAVAVGLIASVGPTMLLAVLASRALGNGVRHRDRTDRRDAALRALAPRLLELTDPTAIRNAGRQVIAQLCESLPGLRVIQAEANSDGWQFSPIAGEIPPHVLDRLGALERTRLASALGVVSAAPRLELGAVSELDGPLGAELSWVRISVVADTGDAWLLLGAPGQVSGEALVAIGDAVNQVTLALQRSRQHHELTAAATTDTLTGLGNRSSFSVALSDLLAERPDTPVTVLFIDLDDFKHVNDGLGHRAGDDLLIEIATRLRKAVRSSDLCARLGGDEFAVLLIDTDQAVCEAVARRIVEDVAAPVMLSKGVAHVGASVGVANSEPGIELRELVHRADVAMYAAKAQGKGRIQAFNPGLLESDDARTGPR